MTIEEKAKAYDEALARAKTYLTPDTPDRVDTVSAITTIFPKLAESEDEKVRNGLVRFLKELLELGGVLHDEWDRNECEKYIAWLEKQKEPNPFTGTGFNYNGNTWGMCARDNGVDILFNSKLIRHISEEKQGQKPADWSEEDKKILNTLIAIFEVNYPDVYYKLSTGGTDNMQAINSYELIKWLKSLKDRCIPQSAKSFDYENANIQQKDFASLGLSEHEKEVLRLMTDAPLPRIEIKDLKEESALLLGYAFKEFQGTLGEVNRMRGYEEGKADALKNLPKWEKIVGSISDVIPLTHEGYLYYRNWRIKISDLWEKLETEE